MMKNLLFVIALLISTFSYSQYIPMLEEGNNWSVDVYDDIFDPPPNVPCCNTNTHQIYIGEVEIVNGIEYKRIYRNNQSTCLLREENGVVYKYDPNNGEDRVLIDMTLEQNDTFNLIDSAYDGFNACIEYGWLLENELTVEQVETLEIAGVSRKVITFSSYNQYVQFKWIEGIGNNSGFDMLWELVDITGGSKLVCFETNGISYFFNDATSCDNTTLGLNDHSKERFILYPNPITEKSILQLPPEAEIDQLKIFNISGKLIKEETITTENYILNNMDYASGLYFYQVSSKGQHVKTEKFIVK